MHITDYELYQVPPRWLFLRIETSDGLIGWGEPIVEGRANTVETAVKELMDSYLLGNNPLRIEDHWQTMYRGGFYRGGPVLMSAIAGIDQALWDIKGKHYGAPVYELLGGPVRDRIRMYQSAGGATPAESAEHASATVDAGFSALKTSPQGPLRSIETPGAVMEVCEHISAMCEAIGPDIDLAVDFHGRVAKPLAKRLIAALEPYDLMFVEEPVTPQNSASIPALAARTETPIATGERLYSRWDFKPLLELDALDVVQPDLSHAGGITECHKIASMAEAYDVAVAPHCPLGPIALASSIQLDACAPNALIQEQSVDIANVNGSRDDLLSYLVNPDVFSLNDGYVELPSNPGLGIELDIDTVTERSESHNWKNPVLRHDDGSLAEW